MSSGWQKKGVGHAASLPWLFWGLVLRVARWACKWSCSWFIRHSQNWKTFYFSCINTGQEGSTESSMKVTLYHPSTTTESTQCYILIQTFKLEWKWHSASCNTHPAVGYFSWTTSGLVIHLGQGVIHKMNPFSVTAQQVFSVSFTTANHILIENSCWCTSPSNLPFCTNAPRCWKAHYFPVIAVATAHWGKK